MAPVKEAPMTYVMPIYGAASWISLALTYKSRGWVLPVSSFGAIWAVFNTIVRRGNFDAGCVTMGLVSGASLVELAQGKPSTGTTAVQVVACVLAALNHYLVFAIWPKVERKALKGGKSLLWLKVFRGFLISQTAFWFVGCVAIFRN